MVNRLLPIAILIGATISATPPPPPLFSVYDGTCNALGKGLGSYKFDPYPDDATDSGCFSIPSGTGTVLKWENVPSAKFPCGAFVYNNNGCADIPNSYIDGAESDVRCRDGRGIYSYEVVCDAA
ncbi:hypothetical protein EJ03DRAFT_323310 [Teratosphaeria nubilosa]|uniref:SSCRP protein n=1 Tax=Teratosphaeria nubilosa TaxID=161662 RepID=A0A6G1LM30_9PEZI|nr:hypothetical protein EJ03DRAFT_323310 [Teratosphaeria nubilosa]